MAPKRDPRRGPVPTPAPADFLGAKKKPLSAAAPAKYAGGPQPSRATASKSGTGPSSATSSAATSETRGDKRQRHSSGFTAGESKKSKDSGYDPQAAAQPLGAARNPLPPPSPTTSVSTVHSEVTDGGPGPIIDREVGNKLEEIKA